MSLIPDVAVIAREGTARLLYSDPSESEKNNYKNFSVETASAAIILSFVEVMQKSFFWYVFLNLHV